MAGKNKKVSSIIIYSVIVLIIGILTLFMEVSSLQVYQKKWENTTIKTRLSIIAENYTGYVSDLFSMRDQFGLDMKLKNLTTQYKSIKYAIIVDKNDMVISSIGLTERVKYFRPKEAWLRQAGTQVAFGKLDKGGAEIYQVGVPFLTEGTDIRIGSLYIGSTDKIISSTEFDAFSSMRKKIITWSIIGFLVIIIVVLIGFASIQSAPGLPEDLQDRIVISSSDSFEHIKLVKDFAKLPIFPTSNSLNIEFNHYKKDGMVVYPFMTENGNKMIYAVVSSPRETSADILVAKMVTEALDKALGEDISQDEIFDRLFFYLDFLVMRGPKFNFLLVLLDEENLTYKLSAIGDWYFGDIKSEGEAHFERMLSREIGTSALIGNDILPTNISTKDGELNTALYFAAYPDESIMERVEKLIDAGTISPVELEKIQDMGGFGVISLLKR